MGAGHGGLAPFLARTECRILFRSITPPMAPLPAHVDAIPGRPPFPLAQEIETLRRYRITHLVTKNSGGDRAKLDACAALGLPVVMIARPAPRRAARIVATVAEAVDWLSGLRIRPRPGATVA